MRESQDVPPPASGRGLGGGQARPFRSRNTPRAKSLRNEASPPERFLWQRLRNRQLNGHKFSRQMPLGPYFCDFLCREAKLIIELDGSSHDDSAEYDARRDAYCRELGFTVLRFQNAEVIGNIEGVLSHIMAALAQAHPQPLPPAGGE
ncbi:DUF559 domain-containing protein [Sphingobium indicum]|uniref:DUF559 domain-containing protein n=1 Tax=Sphingobium indicum TaxID=332055 RepID=A0A4V1WAG7_9SPHN|nr:endonuclease domain-containing protein [Sphingobium indicum]RYM03007.1 DUF559 domain-containing protein [Sphingobium indicum]